jgi:hypothetical protein
MHVSGGDPGGERMRRSAAVLLGLVVLLALVAIASTGSTPTGSGFTRRPAEELVDTLVSLVLIAVLAGSVLIFYVYYLQRAASHEERRQGGPVNRRALMATIGVVVCMVVIAARMEIYRRHHGHTGLGSTGGLGGGALAHKGAGYEPRFATVPVIVILCLAAVAALAAYVAHRTRLRELAPLGTERSLVLTLADVLAETLDDLRAEPDARKAVVAAYARLERTLAAYGVPRRPSEAPEEYLQRVLVDLDVDTRSASRLTALFAEAKFSQHPVLQETKEEAIELLESIRADLLAAEEARVAAQQAAAHTEPEPEPA